MTTPGWFAALLAGALIGALTLLALLTFIDEAAR